MSDARTVRFATEAQVSQSPFPSDPRYQPILLPDGTPEALAGGMGVVYHARDTTLDRDVAVKRMLPQLLQDSASQKRFVHEAKAQSKLKHQHIVSVYSAYEDFHGLWLVLEWVDGQSLQALYGDARGSRPDMADAVRWVLQIADALHYAHQHGFVHRDVKPHNILLRKRDCQPLLTDFGLVSDQRLSREFTLVSVPGLVVGTQDFMAPEQTRDSSLADHRADQWALAKTLHWLLTGKATTVRERDLPPALRDPVLRALEDEPDERFPNMLEFAEALQRAVGDSSAAPPRPATGAPGPEPVSPASGRGLADLVRELMQRINRQHALARELLAGQRYAEAVAALEEIPTDQRHHVDQTLYQQCVSLRDQVLELDRLINAAASALRFDGLKEQVQELIRLQPWREDLEELLKTLPVEAEVSRPALLTVPFDAKTARAAQVALAQSLKLPEEWTNGVGMTFRPIPAGTYKQMTITKPFWLGVHQVTQGQWERVMGTTPWKGKEYTIEGADVAATYISWHDAVAFCERLSKQDGRRYRLPTEAEWEWACRAGTATAYSFGDDEQRLGEYAWFDGNAQLEDEPYAHRVGQKWPNPFGLYDVHGNVWEWCSDRYGDVSPVDTTSQDPQGPASGSFRVLRGGSWGTGPVGLRSSLRHCRTPGSWDDNFGCRVLYECG